MLSLTREGQSCVAVELQSGRARFRNRLAHAYFLAEVHCEDLRQLVTGPLSALYSPR